MTEKTVFLHGAFKMAVKDLLHSTNFLEKELHSVRNQILKDETELIALEKQLFELEHQLSSLGMAEFEKEHREEEHAEHEMSQIKKTLGTQIKKLSSSAKAEKLSSAISEYQLLHQELESLQMGFRKELERAGKA